MREGGLVEVLDASARFVGEATGKPGSVVLAAMEGTRPLLVEVQALVSPSELVPPRRVGNGIDRNRLALVLAVLGRHAGRRRQRRRLRQRRRRRSRRGARRRPRGRARGRQARRAGVALARRRPGRLACFGEVGLDRRAALRRPRRPAPRGGRKFGLAGDRVAGDGAEPARRRQGRSSGAPAARRPLRTAPRRSGRRGPGFEAKGPAKIA